MNLDGVNSAPPEECVINGNYQVRIEYGSALSNYVQFTVPSGSNIFEQQINQNIQLSGVTSSFSEFGTTAKFCHACVKDGTSKLLKYNISQMIVSYFKSNKFRNDFKSIKIHWKYV